MNSEEIGILLAVCYVIEGAMKILCIAMLGNIASLDNHLGSHSSTFEGLPSQDC